jgi:lysyl endopeptidase
MKMSYPLKSAMLVICLVINTANANDGYPAEELTTATAPDSRNYGDVGQARFINGKYVAPLLTLPELSAEEIATLATRRSAQMRSGKPLQVGIGRGLTKQSAYTGAKNVDTDVTWRLLNFSVASKGARALRLGFALEYPKAAAGLTLRFGGSDGEVFEVAGSELTEDPVQWSPIVFGEVMRVEIGVARGYDLSQAGLKLLQISHFDVDPTASDEESVAKIYSKAGCSRTPLHVVCRASPPRDFLSTADAVAKMVFTESDGSYTCTGTLLNNTNSQKKHLFWSAAHCIETQAVANTLQTIWFYQRASCDVAGTSTRLRRLTGGAFLRHRNATRDTLLLELKTAPPSGAVYAAWNSAAINSTRSAVEVIDHPNGYQKKYALGTLVDWDFNVFVEGSWYGPFYEVAYTSGLTDFGSSGAGLFTITSDGVYQLRGGLAGGEICTNDSYSRFGDVYESIKTYFRP